MSNRDENLPPNTAMSESERRGLPPAALRALAEAQERRRAAAHLAAGQKQELGGRGGQDPARYGDWEIKGRAIDF